MESEYIFVDNRVEGLFLEQFSGIANYILYKWLCIKDNMLRTHTHTLTHTQTHLSTLQTPSYPTRPKTISKQPKKENEEEENEGRLR